MSARAPIGASNRSDLFTSRSSGRQDTQEHRKVSVEQEYEAKQEEEDDDPLQLEHMLGYSGVFPKTVIASPYDENTFVKSLGSLVSIENLMDPHDQKFFRGHDMPVSALAMSNDGSMIASGQVGTKNFKGNAAPIFVWSVRERRRLQLLRGLSERVNLVCFSPDDRFICGCGEDALLYVWELATGEVQFGQHLQQPVSIVKWMSAKKVNHYMSYELVFGIGNSVSQAFFDYDPMRVQWTLKMKQYTMPPSGGLIRSLYCIDISEDKNWVFIGSTSGDLLVFRRDTMVFRASINVCSGGIQDVIALPDGSLICAGGDGTLCKLDGYDANWEIIREARLEGKVKSLSLAANSAEVLASCSSGNVYRCLAADLTNTVVSVSHTNPITCIAFMKSVGRAASSVDAFIFATGTDAGAVKVWDLTDYACISSSSWPKSGSVLGLSMANAETILSCWEDGSVKCTDSLGKLLWHIPTAHRDGATSIATYLDNERQFFVTGGGDGAVRVWKYSNRELVSQYTEHRKGVARVLIDEVSPNIVHSVGKDCSVLSYDLKAARRIICHIVNNGTMFNMTQRKDHENELVTCDSMGRLLFWDIDLREPVMVVQDPSSLPIRNCEISPSGRFLVFVCDDLLVKVLDVNTSAVISLGQGHTDKILSVAWSPDERQVVTVGADMCMCVWNFYLGGAN